MRRVEVHRTRYGEDRQQGWGFFLRRTAFESKCDSPTHQHTCIQHRTKHKFPQSHDMSKTSSNNDKKYKKKKSKPSVNKQIRDLQRLLKKQEVCSNFQQKRHNTWNVNDCTIFLFFSFRIIQPYRSKRLKKKRNNWMNCFKKKKNLSVSERSANTKRNTNTFGLSVHFPIRILKKE
jgi:hypothetical protein